MPSRTRKGPRLPYVILLAAAIAAALLVVIAAFFQWPIGYWFLGAGGAGLAALGCREQILSEPVPGAIVKPEAQPPRRPIPAERLGMVRRIGADSLTDLARMAFSAMGGIGLVWAAQTGLNLWRDHVSPASVARAEEAIGRFTAQFKTAVSLEHVAIVTAVLCVAAVAFHSWRPIAVAARARKLSAIVLGALSAMTSFTFVAIDRGYDRYDQQLAPIRASVAHDVKHLAAARREAAALQWITAEWSAALDTPEKQAQFGADLRALVAGAIARCGTVRDAYDHGYSAAASTAAAAGSQVPAHPSAAALNDLCDPTAFDRWLAENLIRSRLATDKLARLLENDAALMAYVFDDDTAASDQDWTYDLSERFGEASRYVFGGSMLPDRDSLARYAGETKRDDDDAKTGRDAIHGIVVESVVALVGVDFEGPVGSVIDSLQEAVADLFVSNSESGLARFWAKLNARPASAFAATPEAKALDRSAIGVLTPRAVFANGASAAVAEIVRTALGRWSEANRMPTDASAAEQRGAQDAGVDAAGRRDDRPGNRGGAKPEPKIEPRIEPRPVIRGR